MTEELPGATSPVPRALASGSADGVRPGPSQDPPNAVASVAVPRQGGRLRRWVERHEDSWLFTVLYVGLAVTLSLFVSLFWLVVLVFVHLGFEWIAQGTASASPGRRLVNSLGAVKLDAALVVFALVLSLYLETVFGLLGLRSAAQVGAAVRVTSRFAALERVVRGVLLSVDDAMYVARAFFRKAPSQALQAGASSPSGRRASRNQGQVHAPSASGGIVTPTQPASRGRWSAGDWIAAGLLLSGFVLLTAAPWLTDYDYSEALARLGDDLRPFP